MDGFFGLPGLLNNNFLCDRFFSNVEWDSEAVLYVSSAAI